MDRLSKLWRQVNDRCPFALDMEAQCKSLPARASPPCSSLVGNALELLAVMQGAWIEHDMACRRSMAAR